MEVSMRFFFRKAAPRPALGRWPVGVLAAAGGDVPRSYEAMVREAYEANAIAQRAVRLVIEGVGGLELCGCDGSDEARALIAAPSAGQRLLETLALHLVLHGNAYVETVVDGGGRPVELYALRPERVRVEPGPRGWPMAH